MYFFRLRRRKPARVKQLILGGVRLALGPDYDIATHFTPRYNPWDQRLCLVPDGDLFKAIKQGRASVVTNQIETFTEKGIRLKDGSELEADIIVTATGLNLQVLGGIEVSVDGRAVDFARTLNYKGMMYSRRAQSGVCVRLHQRLLDAEMRPDLRICLPPDQLHGSARLPAMHAAQSSTRPITELPSLDFSSGYVQRSIAKMPKQGSKRPWRLYQNYALDIVTLRFGKVDDGVMRYS